MVSVKITDSSNKDKKLMAIFSVDGKKTKTIHFGLKGSSTYLDHKDDKIKKAYLARHKVNENWLNYDSAGALSRWILWDKTSLKDSINSYKKRFNLK
jgi:hypothetical protein